MPSFDELQELANLVQPNKIKNLVLFGVSEEPTNKMDVFYRGLAQQKFKNDEEAALALYENNYSNSSYEKLKERLYQQLLNSLFFIDIHNKDFKENQIAYQECLRHTLAFRILLSRGYRKSAISLAIKTLKQAQKYDYTDLIIMLARDLRTHYAGMVGNLKKFKTYDLIVERTIKIQAAELKAEKYYAECGLYFVRSKAMQKHLVQRMDRYANELIEILKINQSFRLSFISFLFLVMRAELTNTYAEALQICKKAIRHFETKYSFSKDLLFFTFYFKMTAAYIRLSKYKRAQSTVIKCIDLMPDGLNNWYFSLDYQLIILYHTAKFQKSYQVYSEGLFHKNYYKQYPQVLERWKLHEAIINYLILTGKINPGKKNQKFRLNKFLNEVPEQSKDKRGSNITILILHILFLLQQEKYSAIIDRVESLKTYSHRYLRQDDTFRSNCFIKMLIQLPAANFHREAVVRKANPYWKKMLSVPLHKANQAAELEIIPYETLWEFVLDSLDNKFHQCDQSEIGDPFSGKKHWSCKTLNVNHFCINPLTGNLLKFY